MSNETKSAIKSAVERLEKEQAEQLQKEIYEYLQSQLELVEKHKERKAFHEGQIRVYEENIKNVKAGNLEAIEKRRKALNVSSSAPFSWTFTSSNPNRFFNDFIAGFTYTASNGRT